MEASRAPYSQIIQNSSNVHDESQFKKAYDFFRRKLRDQIDGSLIDPAKILHIIESRLMVVMINLSDNDDPYLIFESLNFKGSPLEQADLVRNYFLMRFSVSEQQGIYDDLWLPMQNRLGPNLTEFMRHFLGAEGEEIRKGDVYTSIKKLVADSEAPSVRLLMSRMESLSVLYSRIIASNPEASPDLHYYFEQFRRLDFGTAYPLLLALYEDYEDAQFSMDEFIASLRVLFSFIIRRMIVGVPSNSLSGFFIGLCKRKPVTETPSAWLAGILAREDKNRRWPTDGEFTERWLRTPLYGSRACSVILEAIENDFDHHEPVQFDEASIEHVMPQSLTPEWETMLGHEAQVTHREWLHTIGNLTLTGYNPELSNKSYAEKRQIFALSHFELNRYFRNVETWGPGMIRDRAESLLKIALQLWPRPPEIIETPSLETGKTSPSAAFHSECVHIAEQNLGTALSKLSQTRYASGDGKVRLICAVSSEHNESAGTPYYWFAFHESQLQFATGASKPLICLGCGSVRSTLLLPLDVIKEQLDLMSVTKGEDRHYWHIVIQKRNDRFFLRLLGSKDGPELTVYNIGASITESAPA